METIKELLKYSANPEPFASSTGAFWDDEHISKGMLDAHLNPNWDAATRKPAFIEKAATWLTEVAPVTSHERLLDIGCGPGLYAERFRDRGYQVTGVDFSKRSINYAKEQTQKNNSGITYHYQNYLEIDYHNEFELVTLIYCDYGVLSHENRRTLLSKLLNALNDGGKFVFDVFTPKQYVGRKDYTEWYMQPKGGFWNAQPHVALENHVKYDEYLRLEQTIVLEDTGNIHVYNIWDYCFTPEMIREEILNAGFSQVEIYADITGTPYTEESTTMAIVATK